MMASKPAMIAPSAPTPTVTVRALRAVRLRLPSGFVHAYPFGVVLTGDEAAHAIATEPSAFRAVTA